MFPKGRSWDPFYFASVLPLCDVLLKLNVSYQSYADDTLFYVAANFKENDFISVKEKVHSIIINVLDCYKKLCLVVSPDKTEIFSLAKPNNKLDLKSFFVGSYEVRVLNELRSLGVLIDKNWNAVPHRNKVTQTCYFVLRKLCSVGYYLDFNNRVILVKNLILSRLDYCNSLFLGLPDKLIKKLQRIQDAAARFVFQAHRQTSATILLHELHWLPVCQRIKFKTLVLLHKVLHDNRMAQYFDDIAISIRQRFSINRRNATIRLFMARSKYGKRCFTFAGPKLWNSLTQELKSESDELLFRKKLS